MISRRATSSRGYGRVGGGSRAALARADVEQPRYCAGSRHRVAQTLRVVLLGRGPSAKLSPQRQYGQRGNQNLEPKIGRSRLLDTDDHGHQLAATDLLTPLAKHKANINVVTGLDVITEVPSDPPGQNDGHQRGSIVASPPIVRGPKDTIKGRTSPRFSGRLSISSSPSTHSFTPTDLQASDRSSSAWARHFAPRPERG